MCPEQVAVCILPEAGAQDELLFCLDGFWLAGDLLHWPEALA